MALECADVSGVESTVSVHGPQLIYVVTEDWYFWSHRLDLARAARDAGYDVTIATRVTDHGERIEREGFHVAPLKLIRRSRNPLHEWVAVAELIRLYRRVRPDVVHHVAMKPVLYGTIAARVTRVPAVINAFAGLGYTFTEERSWMLRSAVKGALRTAMKWGQSVVLVQNRDDQDVLVHGGIVPASHIKIIGGSGVDVNAFSMRSIPGKEIPIILLPARMLWDKGVREFVEAARALQRVGVIARFVLVGRRDEHNPAAIPQSCLDEWVREGAVEWWGHRDDMPSVYQAASLVVLPSYREGLPKALLEAAACGKAIVATDVPGCREIVRPLRNGLLVPPRRADVLADAIGSLLADPQRRAAMGLAGREIVVREYSNARIADETIALYRDLLNGHWHGNHAQALA